MKVNEKIARMRMQNI